MKSAPPRWRNAADPVRIGAALVAGGIVCGLGLMLVFGLAMGRIAAVPAALVSVAFTDPPHRPPPPPPPPPARRAPSSAPTGAPAPAAIHNRATPIVAPPVPIVITLPPPVITAPLANEGAAAANGAADRDGPGQGAGGTGNGLGGGGTGGNGTGDGGGRPETRPRQIRGRITAGDIPGGLIAPGSEAAVGVRYTVMPDGSTANCTVTRSSGIPALDPVPCRLILQRFRFRPARDGQGRPVAAQIVETHTWIEEPTRSGQAD